MFAAAKQPKQRARSVERASGRSSDELTELEQLRAENQLLGKLVQELKSNKPDAERRVNVAQKRSTSLERRLAAQQQELESLDRDKQQLAAEVQRLSAALNSSNIRHSRLKSQHQAVEDVVLDLRDELARRSAALELSSKQSCQLAEQLQQARRELKGIRQQGSSKAWAEQDGEQQLLQAERHATAADIEALSQAEARLQQEQHSRCSRLKQAQQQLDGKMRHLLGMVSDDGTRDGTDPAAFQELQQVCQEQAAELATCRQQLQQYEVEYAAELCRLRSEVTKLAAENSTLRSTTASLAAGQVVDVQAGHSSTAAVAAVRRQLLTGLAEASELRETCCRQQQQVVALTQQLRSTQQELAPMSRQAAELRAQLVAARSISMAQLMQEVRSAAGAGAGGADLLIESAQLPQAIQTYIKVLEHSAAEAEQQQCELRHLADDASLAALQARSAAASARDAQLDAERALHQQLQQLHRLEALRLSDVEELQVLERRLLQATQDGLKLRQQLLELTHMAKAGQQSGQQQGQQERAFKQQGQQGQQQQRPPWVSSKQQSPSPVKGGIKAVRPSSASKVKTPSGRVPLVQRQST